jgi:hypothetical protein
MSQPANREADILFTLIQTRYGDRVTPDELEEIKKSLIAILDGATVMRAIKLENGDEPHQFFKPNGEPE